MAKRAHARVSRPAHPHALARAWPQASAIAEELLKPEYDAARPVFHRSDPLKLIVATVLTPCAGERDSAGAAEDGLRRGAAGVQPLPEPCVVKADINFPAELTHARGPACRRA